MTAPIERRSTLRKAAVSDDVVGDLVSHALPEGEPAAAAAVVESAGTPRAPAVRAPRRPAKNAAAVAPVAPVPAAEPASNTGGAVGNAAAVPEPAVVLRRGPGRPRSRRRMEPFSSKLEIGLRDMVDAYLATTGESIVDLLDRALRNEIAQSKLAEQQVESGV